MAVIIHVEVLWVMMPCSAARGYQCFGGPCCLHTLPVGVSYISFLSHPLTSSWAGFIHLPIGLRVSLPLLLPVPTCRSTSWYHALHYEDGSNRVLRNVGILSQHCVVSQFRRPQPVTEVSKFTESSNATI